MNTTSLVLTTAELEFLHELIRLHRNQIPCIHPYPVEGESMWSKLDHTLWNLQNEPNQ